MKSQIKWVLLPNDWLSVSNAGQEQARSMCAVTNPLLGDVNITTLPPPTDNKLTVESFGFSDNFI